MDWMTFIQGMATKAVDYRIASDAAKEKAKADAAKVSITNPLTGAPMPGWVLPAGLVGAAIVVYFVAVR